MYSSYKRWVIESINQGCSILASESFKYLSLKSKNWFLKLIKFDYYTFPSDLSAHDDTTTIPDRFAPVIVDGATAFVYQYRGETQQYQLNMDRFEQGIKNMQTLLINKFQYVRSTYIPRAGTYGANTLNARLN